MENTTVNSVLWSVEAILDRGPIDGPVLTTWDLTCDQRVGGVYSDLMMEEDAIKFLSAELDTDPANLTIVSLTWSGLEVTPEIADLMR